MKRFNFGTFLVDDSNREAFDLCLQIAELQPVSPQPVVLMGESGSGKTHLLYAIVNRVRAGALKTGLAYVTAYDFPDQVRALIDDPSPLRKTHKAILLVDQLEEFGDLAEELEAVVRVFLDCGHYVVLGTSVHPRRLSNITSGLSDLAAHGHIVQIHPRAAETQIELIRRRLREESEAQLAKQLEEIRELRRLLEEARSEPSERERRDAEHIAGRLTVLADELEAARIETSGTLLLLDHLAGEIHRGLADNASALTITEEASGRIASLESRLLVEREAIAAERDGLKARLESTLRSREELQTELNRLREELARIRSELDQCRRERAWVDDKLEETDTQDARPDNAACAKEPPEISSLPAEDIGESP